MLRRASRAIASAALCALAALACHEERGTVSADGAVSAPASVELPPTYPGKRVSATFELRNGGRSSLPLRFGELPPPFELVDPPAVAAPGATALTVAVRPIEPGPATAALRIFPEGEPPLSVSLLEQGKPIPACPTPVNCHQASFDLDTEQCIEPPLADGTQCDPGDACILGATCQGGKCIGTPKSCDDGDACTIDVCSAIDGCQSLPAPACPGDGACQLGACDPKTGCYLVRAPDGTPCDQDNSTCISAGVCINGACEKRTPPDGFICQEASPCMPGPGTCHNQVCVAPDPFPLQPSWSFDAKQYAGSPEDELHDFVLEPSGAISLSGWFANPIFRANRPEGGQSKDAARRCILWNARTLCLDYPFRGQQGKVSMVDLATGQTMWTFDLPRERPDFAAQCYPGDLYLSRIAVMGTDRFAALFEAYPLEAGATTNCRAYFLVMLDAQGHMVHATRLRDSMLDRCDHPHPYGFSADLRGNIYIAFSPSRVQDAPLDPDSPTAVLAYSRDGAFLWRQQLDVRGGELAISEGLIYPEQASTPLSADTGAVLPPSVTWGRAVAAHGIVVQAPPPLGYARGVSLSAYGTSGFSKLWTHRLPMDEVFTSYEIRLADWWPRPEARRETVVLGMAGNPDLTLVPDLVAIRARDGRLAWSCPMDYPAYGDPDLFETDVGHLALMEGSETCGRCDPPFAHSHAAFHVFDTPGLYPSNVPWPGTFGGPAHDGREEPILSAGVKR